MDNNDRIRIYHYTKVDTLLRYILPQMRLRMNALANTNDPTEAMWTLLKERDWTPSYPIYDTISQVKNFSFSFDRTSADPSTTIFGFEIHPMWAHYAENWEGVCIEINYDKLIENNSTQIYRHDIRCREIIYTNSIDRYQDIPQRDFDDTLINAREYALDLIQKNEFVHERFFKKDRTWSYEQEYRFVALKDFEEEIYLKLDGAIEKIILGPRFNIHLYPAVRKLIQEHGLNTDIIRECDVNTLGTITVGERYESYYNANRISTKNREREEMDKKFLAHIKETQKP